MQIRAMSVVLKVLLLLTVLWCIAVSGSVWGAPEPLVLIANEDVFDNELSLDQVRRIFLNKKSRWGDNSNIVLVVLRQGETHDAFLEKFVRKTPFQFRAFWKKLVFTGKGRSPRSFATEAELVDYVSMTSGAIGYVGKDAKLEGVKTIAVIDQ